MLFVFVSAAATIALLCERAAARDGDGVLRGVAVLAGLVAAVGLVVLGRVIVVAERARSVR